MAVILPDTTSSTRWESFDAPYLKAAFTAAGLPSADLTVQNALGNDATQVSMAQSAIAKGATVLVITALDSGTGAHIEGLAKAAGVTVIDYDRLTLGGTRGYYVSFDNVKVGMVMGQGLIALHQELGREGPERHRDEGRADRQQRDAVRPGLRRRARPVVLHGQVHGRQQPARLLGRGRRR